MWRILSFLLALTLVLGLMSLGFSEAPKGKLVILHGRAVG